MIKTKLIVAVLFLVPLLAQALPIDRQLVIRPIQICNAFGTCANEQLELTEAFDDAIWGSAGIDIHYEDFTSVVDPVALDVGGNELFAENWFDTVAGGIPDTNVINLWFTRSIQNPFGGTVLGIADIMIDMGSSFDQNDFTFLSARNNILINDDIFEFSAILGVVAHEIGHLLGLLHCNFQQTGFGGYVGCPGDFNSPGNLMSPTGGENLTDAQIAIARASSFLIAIEPVPVPAPWILMLFGIALMPRRSRLSM